MKKILFIFFLLSIMIQGQILRRYDGTAREIWIIGGDGVLLMVDRTTLSDSSLAVMFPQDSTFRSVIAKRFWSTTDQAGTAKYAVIPIDSETLALASGTIPFYDETKTRWEFVLGGASVGDKFPQWAADGNSLIAVALGTFAFEDVDAVPALTMAGNIGLNDNFISNDGNSEAISIGNAGKVTISGGTSLSKLELIADKAQGLDIDSVGGLVLNSTAATEGDGEYGSGISFTKLAGGSTQRVGIVPVQTESDNDRMGIAFLVHSSAAGTDDLIEAVRIKHNRFVGIRTSNPDAPLDVNSPTGAGIQITYNDADGGATNKVNLTVDAGGNGTITPTGNLTVDPSGDFYFNPTGNDVFPTITYDINLGSITQKYLTLHAAELWVQTLVAQDVLATIGGRIIIAPTNILTEDLGTGGGDVTLTVKYNNLAVGDITYMEADGKVEFMSIDSGPTGAGPYVYTVTRNKDGTGANLWFEGDAIVNTGAAGDGFIDQYSDHGVIDAVQFGPTIVGNVRNSSTYNDWSEVWGIGNLNGLYDYSSDTYGAAFGKHDSTNITIDPDNGFRIRNINTVFGQWDNDGVVTVGQSNKEHVRISGAAVEIKDGATVYTKLEAGALTLGATATENIEITSSSINLKDGATTKMSLSGSTITVGEVGASKNNVLITPDSVALRTNLTPFITLRADGSGHFYGDITSLATITGGTIQTSSSGDAVKLTATDRIEFHGKPPVGPDELLGYFEPRFLTPGGDEQKSILIRGGDGDLIAEFTELNGNPDYVQVFTDLEVDSTIFANKQVIFAEGTTSANGLLWGSDVNLYRAGVNKLKTDDSLQIAQHTLFSISSSGLKITSNSPSISSIVLAKSDGSTVGIVSASSVSGINITNDASASGLLIAAGASPITTIPILDAGEMQQIVLDPTTITTSATPSASDKSYLELEYAAPGVTITNFTGGVEGQRLVLVKTAANIVTIQDNANLVLAGADFAMATNDTMELIHTGAHWVELSRSDN